MKNQLLLSLLITLSIICSIDAQSCLPDGITFTTQAQIDSFPSNYPDCSVIEGSVTIWEDSNGSIFNVDSLWQINTIEGNLNLRNNSALINLNGFENLTSIDGNLELRRNTSLSSLNGLSNLTSINGNLGIGSILWQGNNQLTNLEGLHNLTSIGGDLMIDGNQNLENLNGLDGLISIGGNLRIGSSGNLGSGNPALANLESLVNLIAINGVLSVQGNMSLKSLSGLENIDHTTIQELIFSSNDSLSICEIQSICDYLENNEDAFVSDNAQGCNSTLEIETACELVSTIENTPREVEIHLFPNPTYGIINIVDPKNEQWKATIRDLLGRQMENQILTKEGSLDLSELLNGVYILELRNKGQYISKQIMKL